LKSQFLKQIRYGVSTIDAFRLGPKHQPVSPRLPVPFSDFFFDIAFSCFCPAFNFFPSPSNACCEMRFFAQKYMVFLRLSLPHPGFKKH